MRIEFLDPSGTLEVTQAHASRVNTLVGKKIGFLTNEQWQAHRMLPMLKERGVSDEMLHRLTVTNPFNAYAR